MEMEMKMQMQMQMESEIEFEIEQLNYDHSEINNSYGYFVYIDANNIQFIDRNSKIIKKRSNSLIYKTLSLLSDCIG